MFSDLYDGLGPNIEQTLLGNTGLVTIDPENIEVMLSTRFEDFGFGPRRDAFYALLGEGIFNQEGASWNHSRELLRRQFIRMQYQNLGAFQEHVDNMIRVLEKSEGGVWVDLQPIFFRYTLDTTTALIFGQSVHSLVKEGRDSFSDSFSEAANITAYRGRLGGLYWAYTPRRLSKACKAIKSYVDDYVRHARDSSALGKASGLIVEDNAPQQYAFINDLYNDLKDPILVRDQLVSVLLAGRDSTACMMSWTFRLLVRYPAVLAKLREEIKDVLGNNEHSVRRSHVRNMRYLDCVLKETLRLYPPVPANLRFATKATVFPRGGGPDGQGPVLIRQGQGITYSPYLMHRRTDLYGADASLFRPERWEDPKLTGGIKWGFLPFNDGPRGCLGSKLAPIFFFFFHPSV